MASVKQCDRCGAIIDQRRRPVKFIIFKRSLIGSILRFEDYMSYTEHDLCRDCTVKLQDFLKGEELVSDTAEHPIFGKLVNAE